jgi:hypothetical protein
MVVYPAFFRLEILSKRKKHPEGILIERVSKIDLQPLADTCRITSKK